MRSRVFLTAAAAGLACAQALAAPPPTTAAKADPWSSVPALSTQCYSGQDPWIDRNFAALKAVRQDLARQKEINTKIDDHLNGAKTDPMALAQQMQQAMMKDPQAAQKYMERIQQQGQQLPTEAPKQLDKEHKIEAESKTVIGQYNEALNKTLAPVGARMEALRKKLGLGPNVDMSLPDPSWPQWAWKEWGEIRRLWDKLYVANCGTWWSATGPIHAYLKRYRDFLVQERIPYYKKIDDESRLANYKMMGVPTEGWRTTTDYEAAEDYMTMADALFRERYSAPFCTPERC